MEYKKFKAVLLESNEKEMENFMENFKSTKVEVVKSFTEVDELMEYLKSNKIDILLTELVLKNSDGYFLLEKIKDLNLEYEIKTIIISALSGEGFIQKAFDMGVKYYMAKPLNYELLETRMLEILEKNN